MIPTSKIPLAVAEAHDLLMRELLLLNTKWNEFKLLFCADDETIALLHDAAELLFRIVREVLRDDIILDICRVTDPASSTVKGAEKSNLTLEYIVRALPRTDSTPKHQVEPLLSSVKVACEPFRKHRNQRVGHSDLDARLKRTLVLLPDISINETDRALQSIADVLNAVASYYGDDVRSYQHGIAGPGSRELLDFFRRVNRLEAYFNKKEFGDLEEETG